MPHTKNVYIQYIRLIFMVIFVSFLAINMVACDRFGKKKTPELVFEEIRNHFLGEDISNIAQRYDERDSSRKYFASHKDKYSFISSSQHDDMISDFYNVIGHDTVNTIDLLFKGNNQTLREVTLSIHKNSENHAIYLIEHSLGHVELPNRGVFSARQWMYHLGVYPVGRFQGIEVILHKDVLPRGDIFYQIRYVM